MPRQRDRFGGPRRGLGGSPTSGSPALGGSVTKKARYARPGGAETTENTVRTSIRHPQAKAVKPVTWGVVSAGRLRVVHNDGTEGEVGQGDAYAIEPGHDAWVVGDQGFVAFEFDTSTATNYARPS